MTETFAAIPASTEQWVEGCVLVELKAATRVDLEHRHFERHGEGGESMRASVDAPNGWTTIMDLYANRVKERAAA